MEGSDPEASSEAHPLDLRSLHVILHPTTSFLQRIQSSVCDTLPAGQHCEVGKAQGGEGKKPSARQ